MYPYSSSQSLPVKGAFKCEIKIGDRTDQAEFIVIKGNGEPLLEQKTAMKLGVLKVANIADPLSRLLVNTGKKEVHKHESEEYVRLVAMSATPKALTTREVEEASATDLILVEVCKAITNGHFENCKSFAPIAN